jgi:type IV secretion system protein VirB6
MNCPAFLSVQGQAIIAPMLRSVDCLSTEATAAAFQRLVGSSGALNAALTSALTLYIAIMALGMITGRSTLSLARITPRMMTLGLALTFATSWVAYSQTVWTLLATGPDWLAAQMLGLRGSATQALANRLDHVFALLLQAARDAQSAQGDAKGMQPADVLDLSALILMIGSVGVLVTSRIVLAVLLAVGPIFVILSIFGGTRGLFEGWAKATVGFALVPLFAVLLGAGAVGALGPVLSGIGQNGITMEEAAMVLMATIIHAVLMLFALKVTAQLTSGWQMGWSPAEAPMPVASHTVRSALPVRGNQPTTAAPGATITDPRIRAIVAASMMPRLEPRPMGVPSHALRSASAAKGRKSHGANPKQIARQISPIGKPRQ